MNTKLSTSTRKYPIAVIKFKGLLEANSELFKGDEPKDFSDIPNVVYHFILSDGNFVDCEYSIYNVSKIMSLEEFKHFTELLLKKSEVKAA